MKYCVLPDISERIRKKKSGNPFTDLPGARSRTVDTKKGFAYISKQGRKLFFSSTQMSTAIKRLIENRKNTGGDIYNLACLILIAVLALKN